MFGLKKKSKIKEIKKFENEGAQPLSLVEVQGPLKDHIIEHFGKLQESSSEFSKNSGAISSKSILGLLGGAGVSAGGSVALSSQLFIATANPASLMQVGGGVGSAVMGSGGIVGQAAFVPAAGAVLPVALPVIAFQAMNTLVMLKQFNIVNKKLDILDKNIRKILQRDEALFAGEILFATKQLDTLDEQLSISKSFTSGMVTDLSILQSKIGPSFERYRILYEAEKLDANSQREGRNQKHHDSHFLIAFSILELRIDVLKIRQAVQEAPEQLEMLVKRFEVKLDGYKNLWTKIKGDSKLAKDVADELNDAIKEMNWWQRNVSNRSKRKELQKTSDELKKHSKEIQEAVDSILKVGEDLASQYSNGNEISLIYWKDSQGEHSFYISDLILDMKDKKKAG